MEVEDHEAVHGLLVHAKALFKVRRPPAAPLSMRTGVPRPFHLAREPASPKKGPSTGMLCVAVRPASLTEHRFPPRVPAGDPSV